MTLVSATRVPDVAFAVLQAQFTENEIADLTFIIVTINSWNRLAIAARVPAGGYESPLAAGASA